MGAEKKHKGEGIDVPEDLGGAALRLKGTITSLIFKRGTPRSQKSPFRVKKEKKRDPDKREGKRNVAFQRERVPRQS